MESNNENAPGCQNITGALDRRKEKVKTSLGAAKYTTAPAGQLLSRLDGFRETGLTGAPTIPHPVQGSLRSPPVADACRQAAGMVADTRGAHRDTITPDASDAIDDALLALARAAELVEAGR